MRFYATIDNPERGFDLLFRTPDRGGPPTEKWDPVSGEWNEDVSLIDYFTGDAQGVVQVEPLMVGDVQQRLRAANNL